MSFRPSQFLTYKTSDPSRKINFLDEKSSEDLNHLFIEVLYGGLHGICFSLYEDGQKPGDNISADQIRRRMEILKPFTKWIRTFSCIEGNELIPQIAKEFGIKTLVGAWLGKDEEKNRNEIDGLISLAKAGHVDIAVVGNEVLYRNDLTMSQLLNYITEVKKVLPNIPVGYVDAYYEFVRHPELVNISDVILANLYPFWEGTPIEYSLGHMMSMYGQVKSVANGKQIIISETGWPTKGESLGGAFPSPQNSLRYFINTQLWAMDEGIDVFYFSSFDESWKVSDEGEVGAYWGIWDKNEKLKFPLH
ncbi:glycoside hydrolase family 17 protein [Peijinzhouia sedimentorum]